MARRYLALARAVQFPLGMQVTGPRNCLFFLAIAFLVACGDDYDTPTEMEYQEIAGGLAPLVSHELGADGTVSVLVRIGRGDVPGWLESTDANNYMGAFGGLSWDVEYGCEDRDGAPQTRCNAMSNAASASMEIDGTVRIGTSAIGATLRHAWSLEGLLEEIIASQAEVSGQMRMEWVGLLGRAHSFAMTARRGYELSIPREAPAAATGRLESTFDIEKKTDGERVGRFLVGTEIELLGDGSARLVLDGQFPFRIDLERGTAERM
jgi:hypothetical protein